MEEAKPKIKSMTPETKAKEIVEEYMSLTNPTFDGWGGRENLTDETAKSCAIIHVNGIIDDGKELLPQFNGEKALTIISNKIFFWNDVLNEIETL